MEGFIVVKENLMMKIVSGDPFVKSMIIRDFQKFFLFYMEFLLVFLGTQRLDFFHQGFNQNFYTYTRLFL